jgi:hypothetical protein
MKNVQNILFGKHEGKKPLGRSRRRWEDNIRMNLKGNGVGRYGQASSGGPT